ncbi:hypothetical protein NQ315_002761 [Exocentrus adspersus]|uniref:DUF4817 domain-containing protein n=1 Tax=Exocentrus adspersus TaxID=1586481 RepID=A0AAV8VJZ9_9CUCU|nr:hypothetical protein NQ315_002761 [Exocentrus adspersus]
MAQLSIPEKIEMVLLYGECRRSVIDAVALYAERFPDRNAISRASFYRVVKEFTENGTVQPKKRTRRVTVTGENNEIAVLAAVAVNPHASSRRIARDSGISKTSILRILQRHKFHPYHISLHQELHGDDFENRVIFCQWARDKIGLNRNFFLNVLFSDESGFTNHGQVNRHNMHYWSVANPRWLREVEHQRPWTLNVWCGIIGDKLIGPYFIEGTLNGQKYQEFLDQHLPILLEDLTLQERANMWFQHDGCPAHYAIISREVLDREYTDRWIGRGGPVAWPARSPDLTPLDFCLWGSIKEKVYQDVPTTPENMMERIRNACRAVSRETLIQCHESFMRRIDKCVEVGGHHFEHLLK